MDCKILKLLSGEEIITKIESGDAERVVLGDPMTLVITREGLAMMAFMPYSEGRVIINPGAIIAECAAPTALEKEYRARTSGIVMPEPGKLQLNS